MTPLQQFDGHVRVIVAWAENFPRGRKAAK